MPEKRRTHSFNTMQDLNCSFNGRWKKMRLPNSYTSAFKLSTAPKVKIVRQPLWNSSTRLDTMNGFLSSSMDIYESCKDIKSSNNNNNNNKINKNNNTKTSENNNNNNNNDLTVNGIESTEILNGTKIYNLWSPLLKKDKVSSDIAWVRIRKLACDALNQFQEKLNSLECILINDIDVLNSLDYEAIVQKKKEIDAASFETEDLEIELKDIAKSYQTVAQFLPDTVERTSIKEESSAVRKRFYSILEQIARKKELFRLFTPLLEQYKEVGSEMKTWLDIKETESSPFINEYNNHSLMLEKEENLNSLRQDIHQQKDIYENFLEAGESMLDINVDLTADFSELKSDIDDVAGRWEVMCSNLEKCLNRLRVAKELEEKSKKNDIAKIEAQIRTEAQLCTCHTPFQIIKVGDGKYTFGVSKIVRLLRIHGQSIVVRVGGGWEYLFDFLMKADPCRVKQINKSSSKDIAAFNLEGLDLTPIDKAKSSEFKLAVKRVTHWTSYRSRQALKNSSGSLESPSSSSENIDMFDDSSDSSMNLSTSTDGSTPNNRVQLRKQKSNDIGEDTHGYDKKTTPRRISLIERQTNYAEKRRSLTITTPR